AGSGFCELPQPNAIVPTNRANTKDRIFFISLLLLLLGQAPPAPPRARRGHGGRVSASQRRCPRGRSLPPPRAVSARGTRSPRGSTLARSRETPGAAPRTRPPPPPGAPHSCTPSPARSGGTDPRGAGRRTP